MLNSIKYYLLIITLCLLNATNAFSSVKKIYEKPLPKNKTLNKNGISYIASDSAFSVNFRFRVQSRAAMTTVSDKDFSSKEWEMRVRRLRLRFDGFMLSPKLSYYIQLSFSRGDMDWSDADNSKINVAPNPVRDAMIFYKPHLNFTLGFGQGKLPGNRQRVVSSGELQFADRSIVNSTFTLDRDFGLFGTYSKDIGKAVILLKGAISSGKGRQNVVANNQGLCYTGRAEILPFGTFTNKGDYFEGDLEREKNIKVSLAGGYSYNEAAVRTGGQLGRDLPKPFNIKALLADILIKYRGWALSSEYIKRESNQNEILALYAGNYIYTGFGHNHQLSYCFKSKWELAARYSNITPNSKVKLKALYQDDFWFGITKYLNNHRTKLQFNIIYTEKKDPSAIFTNNYMAMFQIELGI